MKDFLWFKIAVAAVILYLIFFQNRGYAATNAAVTGINSGVSTTGATAASGGDSGTNGVNN